MEKKLSQRLDRVQKDSEIYDNQKSDIFKVRPLTLPDCTNG